MHRYVRRLLTHIRPRRVAVCLALAAGVLVFVVGETVFPYLTSNHDEAVYLQQAELLLDGQLALDPPVSEVFRPWFFFAEDGRLYPKYSPVTAGIFALGGLVGSFRLALAVVAAATTALTYAVVTEAFDRRTGVVAAALLICSPLFVVQASVFLSYVPALCLNLLFVWAYLRADRTGSRRWAALAGGAIGLAFFARPYTAVLFAAPFVVHALWGLRPLERATVVRHGVTAVLGVCGVLVALGYNTVVTGDPLTFPYEAFAPKDGLGFGHHEIAGYEREYTVGLALEANARNLWVYATRWTPAGSLGTVLAALGLAVAAVRARWDIESLARARWQPDARVLAIAGVAVTISLGNVYFWGTLNVLGELSDPSDGLISFLGPYYHVGLLVPTVAFGAVGFWAVVDRVRTRRAQLDGRLFRHALAGVALVTAVLAVAATASAVAGPLQDNYEVTRQYEQAYEPFEDHEFENALVFLPTPYGDWLNHPFQPLRNDPGYDGDAVYAMQDREFEVVDAFPNRTIYRYSYRGEWVPFAGQSVEPRLREIHAVRGDSVSTRFSVGLPSYTEAVNVRASVGDDGDATAADLPDDGLDATLTVSADTVTVRSPHVADPVAVPYDPDEEVTVVTYVDYASLGSFEYVLRFPVERDEDGYRALSPHLEVCRAPRLCDGEAAYVPGSHAGGVWMNATLHANDL